MQVTDTPKICLGNKKCYEHMHDAALMLLTLQICSALYQAAALESEVTVAQNEENMW